jgi:rRNA maturation RNase YbeY
MYRGFLLKNEWCKGRIPRVPFRAIKERILGRNYDLSILTCGKKRSRSINKMCLDKGRPANVLSFPLSETSGEIILDLDTIYLESASFGRSFRETICFMFIHGLLHLSGLSHGQRMEALEKKYCREFKCTEKRS